MFPGSISEARRLARSECINVEHVEFLSGKSNGRMYTLRFKGYFTTKDKDNKKDCVVTACKATKTRVQKLLDKNFVLVVARNTSDYKIH